MKKFAITLKSFEIEFQPLIEEINAKEGVIRQYADAATMDRVRSMVPNAKHSWANLTRIQILKVMFRILYRS